jgi:hypothetical protein
MRQSGHAQPPVHPVVIRAGVVFLRRADEGQVFDACDVRRIRAMQVAIGERRLVEFDQVTRAEHELHEFVAFRVRAVHQWMRSGCVSLAVCSTQSRRDVFVVITGPSATVVEL